MIKILFILPQTQQGGAETQLLYLLKNMDRKKFDIYLGLLYENNDLKQEFESIKNIKIINLKKRGVLDILVFRRINKLVKKENIDIIHTFMGNHYAYIPELFCRNVTAVGGIRATTRPKDLSFVERFIRFNLSRMIAKRRKFIMISNSEAGKNVYLTAGFLEKSIDVIPNGIDFKKFSSGNKIKIQQEFRLKNKIVLGVVSRLIDVKNHTELIRNFYELDKKYDDLVLLIVGDGPLMDDLKKLAKSLELDNVIFTGNRKDIADLLSAMDIFLFPSKFEGWPNVVGEAMAAGLPVLAYPVGDMKNIIKNNYNGIISEQNSAAFLKYADQLIENKEKRETLANNAKKTIKENFSVESMVRKYEQFYISILNNNKYKNKSKEKNQKMGDAK
jgi:glycosyltransferase involved in cell wall biosynthesis